MGLVLAQASGPDVAGLGPGADASGLGAGPESSAPGPGPDASAWSSGVGAKQSQNPAMSMIRVRPDIK